MTCRQIAALLEAFLDGELPADQTFAVEEHLALCKGCREHAAVENAIRVSLRRVVIADAAPSAGFEARLEAALREERERALATPSSIPPRPPVRRWPLAAPLTLAAAATLTIFGWLDRLRESPPVAEREHPVAVAAAMDGPEEVLDDLVSYHAAPPAPQIIEQRLVEGLEPQVGVPVHLPSMTQYGASWEGGGVVAMKNQRAAIFRYRLSNHSVTVYVYDARRVPLRGVLEPRVVRNQAVSVGERRGYSIAAREQRGLGYAIATDLNDAESAELVTTIY